MSNPFTYYKKPQSRQEAQSNINYWWYEGMGECPEDSIPANWKTFIREMRRGAERELRKMLTQHQK